MARDALGWRVEVGVDTGASGTFSFAGGGYVTELAVELDIIATTDAVLMMLSESSSFTAAEWLPVSTSYTYTFDSSGSHDLYIKFANANGLETSPQTQSITVDVDPKVSVLAPDGATGDSTPRVGWSETLLPGATYHVQVDDTSDFASPFVDASGQTGTSVDITTPRPSTAPWR